MGWFSSNKPKVTKTKLKNGTLTNDPFKDTVTYVTSKSFKFSRSKGFLSPFKCSFNVFATYNKTPEQEYWGIEIQTYRKLSAPNYDKIEKLIQTEPMWREMDDFVVIANGQHLKSETTSFEPEKRSTDKTRESWSGGRAQFDLKEFLEISRAQSLDMRYYGLDQESAFDLEQSEIKAIKGLVDAALADIHEISPNEAVKQEKNNKTAPQKSDDTKTQKPDARQGGNDEDIQSNLESWLNSSSDEAFIIIYSEIKNVYVQGVKSGDMIHIEATSHQFTDALEDSGIAKLNELGWSQAKGENFTQYISSKDIQRIMSLISDTFACYSVSPLQVKIRFELV